MKNGKAEELIIDKAAADKNTSIVMATHGRSGMQRWLLGSVADKVLHGSTNHLFLIRATEQGKTDGSAFKQSHCTARWLATGGEDIPIRRRPRQKNAPRSNIPRAYAMPPAVTADEYGTYSQELFNQLDTEAKDYLTKIKRSSKTA